MAKILKRGDKFTASQIDTGEFTFYTTLAEHKGAEAWIIAFKDGSPWTLNQLDIDSITVTTETEVKAPPAIFAFKKDKHGKV